DMMSEIVTLVIVSSMRRRPACATLFPYTTLFRSVDAGRGRRRPGQAKAQQQAGKPGVHVSAPSPGFVLLHLDRERLQPAAFQPRSEEHTSELQSRENLVCRLLLEKKNKRTTSAYS